MITENQMEEIISIIRNEEEIEESNESRYTKDYEKMSAYEKIKNILKEEN